MTSRLRQALRCWNGRALPDVASPAIRHAVSATQHLKTGNRLHREHAAHTGSVDRNAMRAEIRFHFLSELHPGKHPLVWHLELDDPPTRPIHGCDFSLPDIDAGDLTAGTVHITKSSPSSRFLNRGCNSGSAVILRNG